MIFNICRYKTLSSEWWGVVIVTVTRHWTLFLQFRMEPLVRHLFQLPNFKNVLKGDLTKSIDLTQIQIVSV